MNKKTYKTLQVSVCVENYSEKNLQAEEQALSRYIYLYARLYLIDTRTFRMQNMMSGQNISWSTPPPSESQPKCSHT